MRVQNHYLHPKIQNSNFKEYIINAKWEIQNRALSIKTRIIQNVNCVELLDVNLKHRLVTVQHLYKCTTVKNV